MVSNCLSEDETYFFFSVLSSQLVTKYAKHNFHEFGASGVLRKKLHELLNMHKYPIANSIIIWL